MVVAALTSAQTHPQHLSAATDALRELVAVVTRMELEPRNAERSLNRDPLAYPGPRAEVHLLPSTEDPTGIGEEGRPTVVAARGEAMLAAAVPCIGRVPIPGQDLGLRA